MEVINAVNLGRKKRGGYIDYFGAMADMINDASNDDLVDGHMELVSPLWPRGSCSWIQGVAT